MNKILIIEDEPDIQELLRNYLEEEGYETEIKLIFFLEEHRWAMIKNAPSAQPADGVICTEDQEICR